MNHTTAQEFQQKLDSLPQAAREDPYRTEALIGSLLEACDGNTVRKQKLVAAFIDNLPHIAEQHVGRAIQLTKSLGIGDLEHLQNMVAGRLPEGGNVVIATLATPLGRTCLAFLPNGKKQVTFVIGDFRGSGPKLLRKLNPVKGTHYAGDYRRFIHAAQETIRHGEQLPLLSEALIEAFAPSPTKISEKTIAVITTGGTIGAAFSEGVTTLNHNSELLKQQIAGIAQRDGFDLRTYAPFNIFSEDMEPSDWGRIMAQIQQCTQQGIKRIVVAHGTDTMAYSAMAASLYYSGRGIKVCFTGAFLPPSDPNSDAVQNIEAALHTVSADDLPDNVYVAFRRTGDEVAIMRGQDISPMAPDKTYFETIYGDKIGHHISGEGLTVYEGLDNPQISLEGPSPTPEQLQNPPEGRVIQLDCYPGMSLTDLKLDEKVDNLIILKGYHSGTMPALALEKELVALKETHPRTMVIMGMHPYRYVSSPYETTANLAKKGFLTIYRDILPHQLYTLAICEISKGNPLDNLLQALEPWRFGGHSNNAAPLNPSPG